MLAKSFLLIALTVTLIVTGATAAPIDIGPGHEPSVTVDQQGHVFLAFARDKTIYFARSDDAGQTFAAPIRVTAPKTVALGGHRGPRIVSPKAGVIVITAIVGEKGGGKDG